MFELSALSGEREENNCGTWMRYSRRRSLNAGAQPRSTRDFRNNLVEFLFFWVASCPF